MWLFEKVDELWHTLHGISHIFLKVNATYEISPNVDTKSLKTTKIARKCNACVSLSKPKVNHSFHSKSQRYTCTETRIDVDAYLMAHYQLIKSLHEYRWLSISYITSLGESYIKCFRTYEGGCQRLILLTWPITGTNGPKRGIWLIWHANYVSLIIDAKGYEEKVTEKFYVYTRV